MAKAFTLTVDSDGLARLVFDLPGEKVNKINEEVLEELDGVVNELARNQAIKCLLLESGKKDCFIAGADLRMLEGFKASNTEAAASLRAAHQTLINFSNLRFPTVAVIDGVCLGGGLEFALACTYRICSDSDKTSIGFPEVNLGILPGWGGTQRITPLIGLANSLPLMLSGSPLNWKKADRQHVVDAAFPKEQIRERAKDFARSILTPQGKSKVLAKRKVGRHWYVDGNPLSRWFILRTARKMVMEKTNGHYPSPLTILDLVKSSFGCNIRKGVELEMQAFLPLVTSEICKNLIGMFFTSEELKKDPGHTARFEPRPIRQAAVMGGGTMGGGIAWLFSNKDIPVRVKDINWDGIGLCYAQAQSVYQGMVKRGRLRANEAAFKMHKISHTINYDGFSRADCVVEAVVENMKVKKDVLCEIEKHVPDTAVICTNTSSLSVTEMATSLKHPERFVGMHFFNPVDRMPLVEIVPTERTSADSIITAVALCKRLGKTPIVVKDCAGFLVNRCLIPYMNEVLRLLEEGVSLRKVDEVATKFGMPMGPGALSDTVGIDVLVKVCASLQAAYGSRMETPALLGRLYESGALGKKKDKGFYCYKNGKPSGQNPDLAKWCSQKTPPLSDEDILHRGLFMMINEAALCLQEGVVKSANYLDMAMVMGTGFAPFRGGLLRYADTIGAARIVQKLQQYEKQYGERFRPAAYLVQLATTNQSFYSQKESQDEPRPVHTR